MRFLRFPPVRTVARMKAFVPVFAALAVQAARTETVSVAEALDNDLLVFEFEGDARWFGQTNVWYDDGVSEQTDAAQSGAVADGGVSRVSTSFNVPESENGMVSLSFAWKIESEAGADHLRFFVNGVETNRISGASDWKMEEYVLQSGETYQLVWEYSKDESLSKLSDAAWVDRVTFNDGSRSAFQIWMVDTYGLASDDDYREKARNDDDNDGQTNLEEYVAGTDPTDPADRLSITKIEKGDGTAVIEWSPDGKEGRTYTVQTNATPGTNGWTDVETGVAAPWTDSDASTDAKFYRVKVEMDVDDVD